MHFLIARDGTTTNASVSLPSSKGAWREQLEACLVSATIAIRYPAPYYGTVDVSYPLALSAASPQAPTAPYGFRSFAGMGFSVH